MTQRGALAEYVDDLQAGGRLTFTREEAMAELGVSAGALKQAALRLAKKGRLVSPRRGFFVIVPLEHRAAGAPPLEMWLPALLRFHGARGGDVRRDGASATVAVDRPLRPIRLNGWRVIFVTEGCSRRRARNSHAI